MERRIRRRCEIHYLDNNALDDSCKLRYFCSSRIEYVIVKVGDEKFIIAKELLETVAEELEWENAEVVQERKR